MKRWLTCCAVVGAVSLLLGALLLLVGFPALVNYLSSFDTQPVFDVRGIGGRYSFGDYDLLLAAVNDSRCPADSECLETGAALVSFELVAAGAAAGSGTSYSLALTAGLDFSDVLALPDGYALRVLAVHPLPAADNVVLPTDYSVRFQLLMPVAVD